MARMKLKIVEYSTVKADFDSGAPTLFNSNFHSADEAPDLSIPTNAPTSFERWVPLVMRSQGLGPEALQVVALNSAQIRLLVVAAGASVHTRVLNRAYAEDLEEVVAPAFSSLDLASHQQGGGLFMRLAACSTKDGAQLVPGKMSVSSADEILFQLTTSLLARGILNNAVNAGTASLNVFFLPFDPRMDTAREYRVFCVPGTLNISAVSQYRWHRPWVFSDRGGEERAAVAESILAGIREVHAEILRDLGSSGDGVSVGDDDLLRRQGFTFDVLFDESTSRCRLIELNTFGARSACGSCLFHWLRDRDLLYGGQSDEVEFRVTL